MRTLLYATLVALSTVAYAEKPAVCNSTTLSEERRAVLCKTVPTVSIPPLGYTPDPAWICQQRHISKLSVEDRKRICPPTPETTPIEELTFTDPRCNNEHYFTLAPAARRQIDCREKQFSDITPICQDYLTGKVSLPEELRVRYCPDVPKINAKNTTFILEQRSTIEDALSRAQKERDVCAATVKKMKQDATTELVLDILFD